MKIYTRTEFMNLPAGVIYAKGKPWYWEQLHIKGDTIRHEGKAIDFYTQDLTGVEADNSDEWVKRLEEMRDACASYPLEKSQGRDGMFDDADLFLVYEPADLAKLVGYVVNAIMAWGDNR